MEPNEEGSKNPMQIVAVVGGVLVALLLMVLLRSRRETSKIDKAFKPIVGSILESSLPDRAKDLLLEAVEDVRSALHSVKDMTDEIAVRS